MPRTHVHATPCCTSYTTTPFTPSPGVQTAERSPVCRRHTPTALGPVCRTSWTRPLLCSVCCYLLYSTPCNSQVPFSLAASNHRQTWLEHCCCMIVSAASTLFKRRTAYEPPQSCTTVLTSDQTRPGQSPSSQRYCLLHVHTYTIHTYVDNYTKYTVFHAQQPPVWPIRGYVEVMTSANVKCLIAPAPAQSSQSLP